MTDKEYREQKARVKKFLDKWYFPIGLGWWRTNIYWKQERDEDEPATMGRTETHWQYRTAAVTFYLPEMVNQDDDAVEECVVHEMTHILVGGLHDLRDDQAREITEYTVTTISRALIYARKAGQKEKNLPK